MGRLSSNSIVCKRKWSKPDSEKPINEIVITLTEDEARKIAHKIMDINWIATGNDNLMVGLYQMFSDGKPIDTDRIG